MENQMDQGTRNQMQQAIDNGQPALAGLLFEEWKQSQSSEWQAERKRQERANLERMWQQTCGKFKTMKQG